MEAETRKSLASLLQLAKTQIPIECRDVIQKANFTTANTGSPYFPCPFKETEATSALKAVEAGMAAAIANLIYGEKDRQITVDLDRASSFLFSAYLSTVDGMNKAHPDVKSKLKGRRFLKPNSCHWLTQSRHRPPASAIHPLPKTLRESVRDQEPGRILPSSRFS